MKLILTLFIGLLGFGAFAQNGVNAKINNDRYPAEAIENARAKGEIILFEKSVIDLGAIKKGSYPEMTFRYLNIGEEIIEYNFFDVCSCSELTHNENAKIKPGEEGTFHIKFDSKERQDEEPVEVNFELKNIDKRNNYPFFYTAKYIFTFK